ncbi:hypothetical protein DRO53_03735 [Candidatus Bathyarchaeota archaeon]|nr:MAG: hypothetical protein DRO53_03735 [Candidatus Bathyarchaeota archaeon]
MTGKKAEYEVKIKEWEYCFCNVCNRIRYADELEATDEGIRCKICGSYELTPPGWVRCPGDMKSSAVKCPVGGKGIKVGDQGIYCEFKCYFRKPE